VIIIKFVPCGFTSCAYTLLEHFDIVCWMFTWCFKSVSWRNMYVFFFWYNVWLHYT